MPQYILIARDSTDEEAPARRMAARAAHLAAIAKARAEGKVVIGLALTDANDAMIGSVVVTNFDNRAEFDAWLAEDPYTIGNVWSDVTVLTGKIAPTFADLIKGNVG